MLEKIDLDRKLDKADYKKIMPALRERLFIAQKTSWDQGIPVVILFEGWDASGKGTSIQEMTQPMDPRGFKLYPIRAACGRWRRSIPGCGASGKNASARRDGDF